MLVWFAAALLIRWAPPVLFARRVDGAAVCRGPAWRLANHLDHQPAVLPHSDQLVSAAALAGAPLYGPDTKDWVPVAALLLWGAAGILVAAFAAAQRKRA